MKKILEVCLLLALPGGWWALACSPEDDPSAAGPAGPPRMDHGELGPVALAGEVLAAADAYGVPLDLALVGPHLVLLDGAGDPAFHVLRPSDGQRLSSFGAEGEGPGEFRGAWSLDPVPDREAFWTFDIALQRLTRVRLREGRPAGDLSRSRVVDLRAPALVNDALWAGPARILASGHFAEGRLGRFDGEGRFLGSSGALPPPPVSAEAAPAAVLQQAYQGRLARRVGGSGLVLGVRQAGRVELFDGRGDPAGGARVPFSFPPRFGIADTERGPVMETGEELRFGYIDVTGAGGRIYALFSGRLRGAWDEGRAGFGRYVHVFDGMGELETVLELDTDAIALAVDPDARALFAARHLPTPAVLRYLLPEEALERDRSPAGIRSAAGDPVAGGPGG